MSIDGSTAVLRGLETAAATAVAAAMTTAGDRLAVRVAALLPDAAIRVEDDAVRITGRGLVARAFGSRQRAADPRLAAIVAGDGA